MHFQAREFANELRASTKAPKPPPSWLDNVVSNQSAMDTSCLSDAYAKMLTVFIPLLVDEVVTQLHPLDCDLMYFFIFLYVFF